MSHKIHKTELALILLLTVVLVALATMGWQLLADSWHWLLLIATVGLASFTLGARHAGRITEKQVQDSIRAQAAREHICRCEQGKDSKADSETIFLQSILEELNVMQTSDDLLERYRSFVRVIESSVQRALGDCGVSLWCPDHGNEKLVECVIHPTQGNQNQINTESVRTANSWRTPCEVPLDSVVIRDSLKSGRAYCALTTDSENLLAGRAVEATLPCDACIPLYRSYGQPLLIQVERTGSRRELCTPEEFHSTVKLIRFFWKQLQSTNQRQWLVEHDEPTGALREEAFLAQGQGWSDRFARRDELFSVVVITVRGFRSMFAGESARWRRLSGILGRSLRRNLTDQCDKFLLGKMADDVFALLLPGIDQFLCETTMQRIFDTLETELLQEPRVRSLETPAVDLQWSGADHTQYEGDLEQMLNDLYCRLFSRREGTDVFEYRIALNESTPRTEVSSCK
jgi:GGDEF domain-containing protein